MTEREMWQQLVQCPGWLLLTQRVKTYWDKPLSELSWAAGDNDDVAALNKLRQVLSAQKAADIVLSIPTAELQRIDQAEGAKADPQFLSEVYSRRGGL